MKHVLFSCGLDSGFRGVLFLHSGMAKEVYIIHSVRGQSGFFNLVLTERNMKVKFDLKLSVYSLGTEI